MLTHPFETINRSILISTIWIFLVLNYLYCDVLSLMDSNLLKQYLTGSVAGIQVTQTTLLLGSILMEISIAMTLLSRFASRATSRPLNIVAAIITFLAQAATLFKPVTSYYMFFSVIEIGASLSILMLAIFWKSEAQKTSSLAL